MKTIADIRHANLLTLISEFGTIAKLAAKLEKSPTQISQLKNKAANTKGTGKPRSIGDDLAREIEEKIGKPHGWMDRSHADGVKFVENMNVSKVPLIAWEDIYTVAYSNSAVQSDKVINYMDFSYKFSDRSFALVVTGDAMLPDFHDGAFIAVDPTIEPVNGNYVVAKNNIGEYTFRKFIIDAGIAYLKPLNNDFPIAEFDVTTIVGVVAETKRILI